MKTTLANAALIFAAILFSHLANAQIIIEAESYTNMSGVDLENTTDDGGGKNVGWIDNGDWMEYDVIVPYSGDYKITSRYASQSGGGSVRFEIDGDFLLNETFNSTGNWQNWQSKISDEIYLAKGKIKLRINITSGGFNLNWMQIHLVNPTDTDAPDAPKIITSSSDVRSVSITWSAAKDATTAVSGYRILNNSENVAFTADTTF
ncbi:MAG: carbohydrate-binding protein, partial [Bacteroidia bacterium]